MGVASGIKSTAVFVFESAREMSRIHASNMAAGLAFFGLFALPPLIVVLLLVGGEIFGRAEAEGSLLTGVEETYGKDARSSVETILEGAPGVGTHLVFTQFLSLGVFLYAAFAGFGHLQRSFNRIWGVSGKATLRLWSLRLVKHLTSFLVVVVIGLLMLFATSAGVLIRTFPEEVATHLPGDVGSFVVHVLEGLTLAVINVVILTALYKVVPDPHVPIGSAFKGAALASVLLVGSRYPLTIYLEHSWRGTVFGAASSLVGLLLALYVVALLLLLGCVASRVAARPLSVPPSGDSPSEQKQT